MAADVTIKVAAIETGYGAEMWKKVTEAFTAQTGIKVDLTTDKKLEDVIGPSMQGGDYPDVVHLATGREAALTEQFIKGNLIADITDVLSMTVPGESKKVSEKIAGGFTDTSLTNPYGDGKTYLAPMFYSPCGLFYNAGLFEEKGSNAWYEMEAKDILPEDFACPHCGSRTGFTKEEIATVSKVFGVVMTLAGAFVGGIVTMRLGILKTMAVGAVLAAVTNLLFAALAGIGHNVGFLIFTVSADNLAAGLASAAFIAYLSSLTNKAYSATQYALFSSLMLLLPKFIAGFSGVMVESLGYQGFFLLTASMGVPVILLVWWVSRQARARELMSGGRAEK